MDLDITHNIKEILKRIELEYPIVLKRVNNLNHISKLISLNVDDLYDKITVYMDADIITRTKHNIETYIMFYGNKIGTKLYKKYCNESSISQKKSYKKKPRPNRESPFVLSTWIKRGLSEEQALERVSEIKSKAQKNSSKTKKTRFDIMPNQIGYWIKKGHTENEAIELVKQRQLTCKDRINGILVSNLEMEITNELQKTYDIKTQKALKNLYLDNKIFLYDINVGNKIIEVNGDYWHCNPMMYESNWTHPVKQKTSSDIWNSDEIKIKNAKEQGYEVLVIWESDYNNNKKETLDECRKFLDD